MNLVIDQLTMDNDRVLYVTAYSQNVYVGVNVPITRIIYETLSIFIWPQCSRGTECLLTNDLIEMLINFPLKITVQLLLHHL